MRRIITGLTLLLLAATLTQAAHSIYDPQVKSLQAVVNSDWLSPPVMRLEGSDVLNVSFDELSHDYHRYIYRLERCEADWTTSAELFESEWLEGFNDNVIDDYERSVNTVVPYTHYWLRIPNDRVRLTLSGNYRLHISDDGGSDVLTVEFMVQEQSMRLEMNVSTNTDVDLNNCHQQLSMGLGYGQWQVTDHEAQIRTVVMQNGRTMCRNAVPSFQGLSGGTNLSWTHHQALIFDAGNEYRKYEILDPSHPTMGIEHIRWDGAMYQAYPYTAEPRPNYIYDEDADGAFYIRNSDNRENETISEYVWVNYRLKAPQLAEGEIIIDGLWTTPSPDTDYRMHYDAIEGIYKGRILQKLGYYNYRFLWRHADGRVGPLPSEGNFYQTENRYQVLIYYKGIGERTWRLTAYRQLIFS